MNISIRFIRRTVGPWLLATMLGTTLAGGERCSANDDPATSPMVAAKIKLVNHADGEDAVISTSSISYRLGQRIVVRFEGGPNEIQVVLGTASKDAAGRHELQVSMAPKASGERAWLHAPKVTMPDGVEGEVKLPSRDGAQIDVRALVIVAE